ncbi:MAG: hypothetical protein JWM80_1024 [Cyanobacteria bacterium RYN_339]|nr:hypothetical protein [Cyanobacteria bacterium RYN_339]
MIDRIGSPSGQPLEGLRARPPVVPPLPPPALPAVAQPTLGGDQNQAIAAPLPGAGFDLGPLPFTQDPPPDRITLRGWRNIVVATHQAGMGGLLDAVARDLAAHAPDSLEALPIALDQQPQQSRTTARMALNAAQRTNALQYDESTRKLALLAGETAGDRPAAIAALKLADRLGGKTEAEHIAFRLAQRATTSEDALATARRALAMGYPDAAKFAFFRAAQLSPDAPGALASAREASQAGLKYEGQEEAFDAWKGRLDHQFARMEGPTIGPGQEGSGSPYRQLPLAKARYIHPYMAAMLKADRAEYPRIAAAAEAAGERQAAALIRSRANI